MYRGQLFGKRFKGAQFVGSTSFILLVHGAELINP